MDDATKEAGGRLGADLRWATSGAVGGLALSGVMLGLRLWSGVPSLPEVTNDRLLAIVPGQFTSAMIDRFQFGAKPLLLIGWQLGLLVVGVIVAIGLGRFLAARPAARSPRRLLDAGLRLGLVYWLVVEGLLLSLLGAGPLGEHAHDGVESAIYAMFAFAAYGLVLAAFWLLIQPRPRAAAAASVLSGAGWTRRRTLAAFTAGGAVVLAGGTINRIVAMMDEQASGTSGSVASASPTTAGAAAASNVAEAVTPAAGAADSSTAVFDDPPGTSPEVTPPAAFYVVSKNEVDPVVKAGDWSLDIRGMVDSPQKLSYQQFLALPTVDQFTTLECISNNIGGDLISNGYWTGVPLSKLLDQVGAQKNATLVIFTSADGYKESLPVANARQPDVLLAHTLDGAPLADKHGFPLRVITPGLYGMKNPKWLTRIELSTTPITGFWEQSGWDPGKGIETMARFDTKPSNVALGQPLDLGGVAFAGDRGVTAVQVSTDGGKSWSNAALKPPLSPLTWALWSFTWTPDRKATYQVKVRAVDGRGSSQDPSRHDSYAAGASGYDTITIKAS